MKRSYRSPRQQRGLTLVEAMIALTLGLMVLVSIVTLFVYTGRASRQNEQSAGMQDQARFALATVSRDLAMAGYWGGVARSSDIVSHVSMNALTAAVDCGASATEAWAPTLKRLQFKPGTTTTLPWYCIGNRVPGTDVVALQRVAGQEAGGKVSSSATEILPLANYFYLKTNGTAGSLFRNTSDSVRNGAEPVSPPYRYLRFEPRIYFVRNYSRTPGDGVPSLCRKVLCPSGYLAGATREADSCGGGAATNAGMVTECIAENVEDFQIAWGIDTDSTTESTHSVNWYKHDASDSDLSNAVTAQIFLLVRSSDGDINYLDKRTYQVEDHAAFTPESYVDADGTEEHKKLKHFRRKLYSTTVNLRNPANP